MTGSLTRAGIVDAALELLAVGGLHALAMRRIATELGVQQSALYWHFDNKQQLLGAIADRLVAAIDRPPDLPAEGDRSARIEALGSRLRDELLRHPDGAELVASAYAFRLGAQQPFRRFTDELVAGGLTLDDAETAASVLVHFVFGFAADEQQRQQAAALGAIGHDDAPDATAVADRFAKGLRLIMSGVDAQITGT